MIMDCLNYIRNLFNSSIPERIRKRRHPDPLCELQYVIGSPKLQRLQTCTYREMENLLASDRQYKRDIPAPKDIIVLEDEIPGCSKIYNSTLRDSLSQDDEVKFVGEFKATNVRKHVEREPFSSRRTYPPFESLANRKRNDFGRVTKMKRPLFNFITKRTPGIDIMKKKRSLGYPINLEDKKEFQDMLKSVKTNGGGQNFSEFFSPNSRLSKYNFATRQDRILNNAFANNAEPLIDLTKDEPSSRYCPLDSNKLRVRDRIMRVIEKQDNLVEIQDSEPEVIEIFPNPPSPKPDIKVDPINSMKDIVDLSATSKKEWLSAIMVNHKEKIDQRMKDIKDLEATARELNSINRDIRLDSLTQQVKRSLQIRNAFLPIDDQLTELPELTPDQYEIIERAFRGNKQQVLIEKFNLNIKRCDILTLSGLNWLNDEVINFYMNLIMERSSQNPSYPKAYCFNTFFYTKLKRDGSKSLRRWTKKVDLFSKDIICVPIHENGVHWCMAIIDFRNLSIKYYDSMGNPNEKCLNRLRNYLEDEHKDKKNLPYSTEEFELESVRDIPQQMNGSDCGMFACTFAEYYTRDAPFTFKQDDMSYFRNKMVLEILSGELFIN